MQRTTITIDGTRFDLAQHGDIPALKRAITDTFPASGGFIDLTVVGNRTVSVLVSPALSIMLESADVPDDSRDTGNLAAPYDELDSFEVPHHD